MSDEQNPLKNEEKTRLRVDVNKAIEIRMVFGETGIKGGWVLTNGLRAFNLPELEIKNIPLFLMQPAGMILNEVADYMLNEATKPILPGQNMAFGDGFAIHFVKSTPHDPDHWFYKEGESLEITDPVAQPHSCSACGPHDPSKGGMVH